MGCWGSAQIPAASGSALSVEPALFTQLTWAAIAYGARFSTATTTSAVFQQNPSTGYQGSRFLNGDWDA